jgi:hypothetical protein
MALITIQMQITAQEYLPNHYIYIACFTNLVSTSSESYFYLFSMSIVLQAHKIEVNSYAKYRSIVIHIDMYIMTIIAQCSPTLINN